MAKIVQKYLKSKYKHTYGVIYYDTSYYYAKIGKRTGRKRLSERQAARDADIMLIELGRKPINILKAV